MRGDEIEQGGGALTRDAPGAEIVLITLAERNGLSERSLIQPRPVAAIAAIHEWFDVAIKGLAIRPRCVEPVDTHAARCIGWAVAVQTYPAST